MGYDRYRGLKEYKSRALVFFGLLIRFTEALYGGRSPRLCCPTQPPVSTQTHTLWECTHSSVINKKNVLYRLHSLTSKGGFHKKQNE